MTDRLVIEITGTLPEKGKHGIRDMHAAEQAVGALLQEVMATHNGLTLTATVRSGRPGKKAKE